MQTKLVIMSTLFTSAARWMISRHPKQTQAFSLSPFPPAPFRAIRWSSSESRTSILALNAEINKDTGKSGPVALIFDTETTGMVRFRDPYTDPSQPDLVQLGFLMVDTSNWKIRNQGSFLVQLRDGIGIDEGAQRVHGISNEDCHFGIQRETVLDLFENLCSSADVLVGHNIRFDAIVMQTAFHRDQRRAEDFDLFASKKQICTMMESIDLCQLPSRSNSSSASYKWPSLEEAHRFVTGGKEEDTLEGAHDALVDSEACLKVFRYLVEHGHVKVEKGLTGSESPDASAKPTVSERTIFTPVSPSKEPKTSGLSSHDDSTDDDAYKQDIQDRNGGIDRSREIEEIGIGIGFYNDSVSETLDRSTEIGGNPKESATVFDPASFSSEMLQGGNSSQISTGEGFRVRGNTYKHKEMIKELGGRWDGQDKEWIFRENQHLSKLESYEDLNILPFSEKEATRS